MKTDLGAVRPTEDTAPHRLQVSRDGGTGQATAIPAISQLPRPEQSWDDYEYAASEVNDNIGTRPKLSRQRFGRLKSIGKYHQKSNDR